MIDLNLGGACPRRPLTYVLMRAMWHPRGPADASIQGCELGVGASNGELGEGINVMADVVFRTKTPWVLANFRDDVTTRCDGLFMIKPMGDEVLIGLVEPYILRKGSPLILVGGDRSRAFSINALGKLIECPVPPTSQIAAGVDRGWAEIRRRMADVIEGTAFRYPSWTFCVDVKHVPVF